MEKQKAFICDVDGTLAIHEGIRGHYEFEKLHLDIPNTPVIMVVQAIQHATGMPVIIATGCEEAFRESRGKWLEDNGIFFIEMHMRGNRDGRSDAIIKEEIYKNQIEPSWDIQFVFDDRDRVVKVWRDLGLTCFQVNYGAF